MPTPTLLTTHRDDLGPVAYSAYSHGCRCGGCRAKKADYVADRRARGVEIDQRASHAPRQPRPRRPPVDRAAVVEHLIQLHRLGWTSVAIAHAARIDPGTLGRVLHRAGDCRHDIAEKILTVPLNRHLRSGRELRTCPCGVEFEVICSDERTYHDRDCARRASAGRARHRTRRFTDDEMIAWMRRAALGDTLTQNRYLRYVNTEPDAPHARSLFNRFGSWVNAVRAAGLTPGTTSRDRYDRRWTGPDLVDAVRSALADGVRTCDDYRAWAQQDPDRPSQSLIRQRLDTWSNAVRLATERQAS